MPYYTKKDIEEYIEYTATLHRTIMAAFIQEPQIHLEGASQDVAESFKDALNKTFIANAQTSAVDHVFKSLVLPFSSWLSEDCLFTGHKAKQTPESKLSSVRYDPESNKGEY